MNNNRKYKVLKEQQKEVEYYIIATKDIKRTTLPSDDLVYGEDATLSDEELFITREVKDENSNILFKEKAKMPEFIIVKFQAPGLFSEFYTEFPIVHEKYKDDKMKCAGIYFSTENELTGIKIQGLNDINMCYDGHHDPEYIKGVGIAMTKFFNKGMESMQIKVVEEHNMKTMRKYN